MKSKKIRFKINNIEVEGKPSETIKEVAKRNGVKIPHLCSHPRLRTSGACRLCIVEVKGARTLQASCSTPIRESMEVFTNTQRVRNARKEILKLLLANHDKECTTCNRSLNCKLQKYCKEYDIKEIGYSGEKRHYEIDNSSLSVVRNPDKCILCGRCIQICNEMQTVYAIERFNRGFEMGIKSPYNHKLSESSCVNCGQCIINCPTGALTIKSNVAQVLDILNKKNEGRLRKHLVVQTAPSIRATLGELFGLPGGTDVTKKMVSALRTIGFDKVFDTDLSADLTIVEEATEFVKRIKKKENLPMITTCCPAWIKFGEEYFFDELKYMSTCRSPQSMLGNLIKTYYAKKNKINPKDIISISIMPCTAKKYEINRKEFKGEIDFVLTTVELGELLKKMNINLPKLKDEEFDNPLGKSTGAGTIFGRSGGVMEAALRTAADFLTGKDLKKIEYTQTRGMNTLKEADVEIGKEKIKIAIVHTLGQARKVLEEIKKGKSPYHFIEIMACYGGCIGGGGQPALTKDSDLKKRVEVLNKKDKNTKLRKSHKNPSVIKIYKDHIGKSGGKKAHDLLHTTYSRRKFIG